MGVMIGWLVAAGNTRDALESVVALAFADGGQAADGGGAVDDGGANDRSDTGSMVDHLSRNSDVGEDASRHDTSRHDTSRHDTSRHDTSRHDTSRHDLNGRIAQGATGVETGMRRELIDARFTDPGSPFVHAQIAELHAEILRLRVMFKALADVAELHGGEFDIDSEPLLQLARQAEENDPDAAAMLATADKAAIAGSKATGVNASAATASVRQRPQRPHLGAASHVGRSAAARVELAKRALDPISHQADRLKRIFIDRRQVHDMRISGRPIKNGRLSSSFGYRTDFATGQRRIHRGLDFAGEPGEPIMALAAGVVTYSGRNGGYGFLVEIEHGDGYRTRYAHNQTNLVAVGERVEKGQTVALLGNTGRSTGPHVHVEVRHQGEALDPQFFLR